MTKAVGQSAPQDPLDAERREAEDALAGAFYEGFGEQRPALRKALAEAKAELLAAQAARAQERSKQGLDVTVDWAELEGLLQAQVLEMIQAIYDQAHVSAKAEVDNLGLMVNWSIFDAAAREQALAYGYDLIKQVNASTRQQIGKAIARWIETPADFDALVEDIWKLVPENPFPNMRDRARTIAQTETTRVYAMSRLGSFNAAGLKRQRWRTAMDELVCPMCGPLGLANEGEGAVGQAGVFADPTTGEQVGIPPRHVGCRCWIVEDVAELEDLLTQQGQEGPQPAKPKKPKKPAAPKKPKSAPPPVPAPAVPWKPAMTPEEAAEWTWGPFKGQQFYAQVPASQWAKVKAGGLEKKYLDLKAKYSKPVGMSISVPVQVNVTNPLIIADGQDEFDLLLDLGIGPDDDLAQALASKGYDAIAYTGPDGELTDLTVFDPSSAVATVNRYGKPSTSTWKPPKKKTPGRAALPASVPESEPADKPVMPWKAAMTQAEADAWAKGSVFEGKTYFDMPTVSVEDALQNGPKLIEVPNFGKYVAVFENPASEYDLPVKVKVYNPYIVTHPNGPSAQAYINGWNGKTPINEWLKSQGYDSMLENDMLSVFDKQQVVYIDPAAAVSPTVAKAPQVFAVDDWDIDHDLLLSRDLHDDGLWEPVKKGKRTTSYGAAVFDSNGRVLLRRPKGEFGGYAWTFPKGGIDPGEHPLTAALREVAEETGHKGQVIGLLGKPYAGETTNTYMAVMRSKAFDASLMDAETEEVRWASKEEAAELIKQGSTKLGVKRDLEVLEDAFAEFEKLQDAAHRAEVLNRIQQAKPAPVKTPLPGKRQPETAFRWKAEELTLKGRAPGATHEAFLYDAPDGSRWMFKPQEEFLAYNDQATYRLASALGHEAAEAHVVRIGGKVGSVQRWYTEAKGTAGNIGRLTPAQTIQAQKEAIFDWLISNHDGHDNNLLVLSDGRLVGIDKGQAFKFWGKDKLDWDYNPNSNVGVTSWHNKTLRAYAAGGDVTLNGLDHADLRAFVNRIEGLDDGEFQAIMRPYAEKALAAGRLPGRDIDAFLAAVTERKNNIGKDFRALYGRAEAARRKALGLPDTAADVLTPVNAELVADIKRSGWQGKSILFGGADIENMTGLVYEIDGDGTVIEFKVRREAEAKLFANLGNLPASVKAAPANNVNDPYWPEVAKVAKSYNHHYKPGQDQIVPAHTKTATQALLDKLTVNAGSDPLAAHYLDYIANLDAAIETGSQSMVGVFAQQYTPPAPKKEERPTARRPRQVDVKAAQVETIGVRNERGRIILDPSRRQRFSGSALNIGVEGATAYYVPHSDGNDNQYSKQGQMRLILDGKASEEKINQALEALGELGLDNRLATPQDVEWMYLVKTTYAAGVDPSSVASVKGTIAQQTEELKRYWNRRLNVADVTKLPSYQPRPYYDKPAPVTGEKDGEFGLPRWRRFDISPEDFKAMSSGYSLVHSLYGGNTVEALRTMLTNNGSLIATEEKLRLGIPLGGMSPEADQRTGGATYVFTRLRSNQKARSSSYQFGFDASLLLDTDVISYDHDAFGRTSPDYVRSNRRRTVPEWQAAALRETNETIIKRNISLLDHLTFINVRSAYEKEQVLQLLRDAGVAKLGGKPIDKVVRVV